MDAADAAALLSAVSANDGRNVNESTARAWAAALPDVTLSDALEYLPTYYRNATRGSRNWIYPGDILEGVTDLQKERVKSLAHAGYTGVTGLHVGDVLQGRVPYPEDHDLGMTSFRQMREIALADNPLAGAAVERDRQKELVRAATPW